MTASALALVATHAAALALGAAAAEALRRATRGNGGAATADALEDGPDASDLDDVGHIPGTDPAGNDPSFARLASGVEIEQYDLCYVCRFSWRQGDRIRLEWADTREGICDCCGRGITGR